MDSRGGYVSKILCVKTKESGPLGGGGMRRTSANVDPPMPSSLYWPSLVHVCKFFVIQIHPTFHQVRVLFKLKMAQTQVEVARLRHTILKFLTCLLIHPDGTFFVITSFPNDVSLCTIKIR